ncbi:hypothetical protein LPJ75_004432, partial [Coemansia sp. RSA 2598]
PITIASTAPPAAVQASLLTTAATATATTAAAAPAALAEAPTSMASTEAASTTEAPTTTEAESFHTAMDAGVGAGAGALDVDTAMAVDSVPSPEASARNSHIESVSADLLASSSSSPGSRVQSPVTISSSGMSTPKKRTQANKGRCFECRARVPLVKQTTNKCRCGYVYCDSHRFYDQHNCEFDFIASDRKVLEKRNPKLNELPKGGRSFNRID